MQTKHMYPIFYEQYVVYAEDLHTASYICGECIKDTAFVGLPGETKEQALERLFAKKKVK